MTATERAAVVLWAARQKWMRDYAVAQREGRYIRPPADAQVTALMADPDLLVDLAIEAGGLRPWGTWLTKRYEDGTVRCNHDGAADCNLSDHTVHPLYRRTEAVR